MGAEVNLCLPPGLKHRALSSGITGKPYRSFRLPRWLSGKESACRGKRHRFAPWVSKTPWRRKWQPIPVLFPGKSQGQRSLAGYGPWGRKSPTRLSI